MTIQKSEYVINAICAVGVCEQNIKDSDFIAHARTDIPALLAEVERMTAEIATLKKEIEQLAEERDAAKRKKDELEAFYEQLCRNIAQEVSK